MRLDRFITLNLVQPVRHALCRLQPLKPQPSTLDLSLPILMYHSISDSPEPGVSAYYQTHTSPAVFRQHIEFLHAEGYKTITPEEALTLLRRPSVPSLPMNPLSPSDGEREGARGFRNNHSSTLSPQPSLEKSVVITFDDGFRDFYTEAFPVLQQHGFAATVFLPTAFIQTARRSFKGTECLTWDEVRQLRECGMYFGAHTVNHPRLIELSWGEVEREVRDSKSELEQRLGEPITTFAHPYAFPQADRHYVQAFRKLLAESGYACCVTTEVGRVKPGGDPYRLKRLPVNSFDDPPLFRAKTQGDYDWLAWPQVIIKSVKQYFFGSRRSNDVPAQTPEATLN